MFDIICMIMMDLVAQARLGETGRDVVANVDALGIGDEAKDVEDPIGAGQCIIIRPLSIDEILTRL
jgi:hypothetical protein